MQNFSKYKWKDNLNVLNISRETLLFINFWLPCTFCSIHWPSVSILCYAGPYLSFWLSLCYSFWLRFPSCELIFYWSCCFRFPENRWRSTFLNFVTTFVTINWRYKIFEKFPRSIPRASLNTLCGISSVLIHVKSNFLLAVWWSLCFEQIDPTWFFSSIFELLAFQYIRR